MADNGSTDGSVALLGREFPTVTLLRMDRMRKADVKKAALAVGGAALAISVISAAGKRQFYKRIVASELKRQLAVVNGKLDNLQAQNEVLRAELARLKQEK